jgi:alkyl sulfatase BDS1-like metallo-beta-lactamase superfamily hydrolase
MKLSFSGSCGSKAKTDKKEKASAQQKSHPNSQNRTERVQASPSRKEVPIDDDKAFEEFIRGLERQTARQNEKNARDLVVLQMDQYKKTSDKIAKLFEPKYEPDVEEEFARLQKEVDNEK